MDYHMLQMDGLCATKLILSFVELVGQNSPYMCLMTIDDSEATEQLAFHAGINTIVKKPLFK